MASSGNILRGAVDGLRRRLPGNWDVEFALRPKSRSAKIDGTLRVIAPDHRSAVLGVAIRQRLEPRAVLELAGWLPDLLSDQVPFIVVPYLSPEVRERLRAASIAFLDLTGNVHLELSEPGLFIETQGAAVDPDRKARPSRSLRGAKAGRVVRVLVDSRNPPGVRELAGQAAVDPGYVSRVLSLLDREALIERRASAGVKGASRRTKALSIARPRAGPIEHVDWPRLLRRWAQDAPLESRGVQVTCLQPRGLEVLLSRLKQLGQRYAITGTAAAASFTEIAAPRLAMVYVEDANRAITELGLHVADAGANVLLIEPRDVGVFAGAVERDGLWCVAVSQTAADLFTSPGRGPAEAEALIEWMRQNEEIWRG